MSLQMPADGAGLVSPVGKAAGTAQRARGTRITQILLLPALALSPVGCKPKGYDVVIANAHYLQGDRISAQPAFIGITGDKIAYIGEAHVRGRTVVNGAGRVLAPGFIDVNACGWLTESAANLKLQDGITTCLIAHGDSFNATAKQNRASEKLNYATSVGVVGAQARRLTRQEIFAALEDSLRFGAYTVSLSPEYNGFTTPELVADLAQHFAGRNVLFTFHTRYSSAGEELEGLREALLCAEKGIPVHILHITSTGATFHPAQATEMIKAAVSRGAKVSFDFYPYRTWASSIHRARFDGNWRERYQVDWSAVHISGEALLNERRFMELMQQATDRNVMVDSIPQSTVDYFALNTACPVGTDSEANPVTVHPRGAGSFTKFINDYVDSGKISFPAALHRLSTLAARQFASLIPGLGERGSIEIGKVADLVLWDRGKIRSHASLDHPLEPSSGVVAAFVNGVPVVLEGSPVRLHRPPGRQLKGNWARE